MKTIHEKWKAYLGTYLVAEEKKLVSELEILLQLADSSVNNLLVILQKEDKKELAEFTIKELYPAIDPVSEKFSAIIDVQLKVAKEEYEHAENLYSKSRNIIFLIVSGALISVIFLSFVISSYINRQTFEIYNNIADIAKTGNLTKRINILGKDELGQVASSVNELIRQFSELISKIKHSTVNIAKEGDTLAASSSQDASASVESDAHTIEIQKRANFATDADQSSCSKCNN